MIRHFGANIIVCQLDTGERRWYIFGCYLTSGDGTDIQYVEAGLAERPKGKELIFSGKFNVDLEKMGGRGQDKEIAVAVETTGIENVTENFLQ